MRIEMIPTLGSMRKLLEGGNMENNENITSSGTVTQEDLQKAVMQMRCSNISLISSSIRFVFNCFQDIDINRFEGNSDYLIHFKSIGNYKYCGRHSQLRPVSILWPSTFEHMTKMLSELDYHLLNTKFKQCPADWMVTNRLTTIPNCKQCSSPMLLTKDENRSRLCWTCTRTSACLHFTMPIQRPSFFRGFEEVSLNKLLFSIYYWAVAANRINLLNYTKLNLDQRTLDLIWRKFQSVCRAAIEDFRVVLLSKTDAPIDLVSIKFRDIYIICAKSPLSNLVRLGLYIPGTTKYNYAELTERWFAPGSHIRVAEEKFLGLRSRKHLNISLVTRRAMISKYGMFDKDSAFGYIICQLAHIFKDFESSSISNDGLTLVLAELQWREIFGTTPRNSFNNIVCHMSRYGDRSDWYSEPALPVAGEETITETMEDAFTPESHDDRNQIYAEHYFYATNVPIKKETSVSRCLEPDTRFKCHICSAYLNNFQFAKHHIVHVEKTRMEGKQSTYVEKNNLVECKHCFRLMDKTELEIHYDLFRADIHTTLYACRICCLQLRDRATYLQHMRRLHFESEAPYRCPLCKYASSYQRQVFIHFQEAHKSRLSVMCPFCLRSFTIRDTSKMTELSELINDHMNFHYALTRANSCTNCCCTFLTPGELAQHIRDSHNPLQLTDPDVEVQTNIITPELEKYCVKALPMELFVANKKPNMKDINNSPTKSPLPINNINMSSDDEDDQIIHVRGAVSSRFLEGGEPHLIERSGRRTPANTTNNSTRHPLAEEKVKYTSGKVLEFMSKMPKADNIIADQIVIVTDDRRVTKCCECREYITEDHFVEEIFCTKCKFITHCPRSMIRHKLGDH